MGIRLWFRPIRNFQKYFREVSRRSYTVWWIRQNTNPTLNVTAWVDTVGEGTKCKFGFSNTHLNHVTIGARVELNNTTLVSHGHIDIEDDVSFGYGCQVLAATHDFGKIGHERQKAIIPLTIRIKKGAFIASGSILTGNITIGEHAVVGAGSVVTNDVPDGYLVAGVPAKPIKKL